MPVQGRYTVGPQPSEPQSLLVLTLQDPEFGAGDSAAYPPVQSGVANMAAVVTPPTQK